MAWDLGRIESLFHEALSKPAGELRAAYLEGACSGDSELRQRVEALLAAHAGAEGFLALPTVDPESSDELTIQEKPGTIVGRYKLLQQIGEGGFGVVFMAEQEQPVRRRVALKIIKLGMDTRQVVARFEAERQALAMMDHPGIARVFDGGATETGRPYFVMELVKGVPLVSYCDTNNLDVPARLDLFAQVCQAVQHAHQKGLIHRDIKPSNVLVAVSDGRPVAKVIDFGIAKAVSHRLTEKTLFTDFRQLIGTPEYMSPEQASGSLDVDTRSDVYSLGVLLYELLTGSPPLDPRELRSKAFAEMQRIIREVDPPTPSNRLSTMETLPSVAALRRTEPRKLCQTVRGELDWIVMKCLEKDRARRYDSAAALAADLAHHMADEPISAGAPSRLYRAKKFFRRHRGPVIATAAVAIAMVAGIIGTTIGLVGQARQRAVAEQQRTEAQKQEKEAKTQAAMTQAVGEFLTAMLTSADPEKSLGEKVTVLQVVTSAITELDAGKLKDQPLVEGAIRDTIGNVLRSLGEYDLAEKQLRRAVELNRQAAGPNDPNTAESLQALGIVLTLAHKLDDAERAFREALSIRLNRPSGPDPLAAASLRGIAGVMLRRGNYREAETILREALDGYRKHLPPKDPGLGECVGDLGLLLAYQSRFADAEPFLTEALDIFRANFPPEHPQISAILNNLALLQMRLQRVAEAEESYTLVLNNLQKTYPPDHPNIALLLDNLAEAQWIGGKLAQAEQSTRTSLRIRKVALSDTHPDIATTMAHLAMILKDQGKLDEAEPLAVEALDRCRRFIPKTDLRTATVLTVVAELRQKQGEFGEAEALATESLDIYRQRTPPEHLPRIAAVNRLAGILLDAKRYPDAESCFREALAPFASNPNDISPPVIVAHVGLGLAIAAQHRYADAEPVLLKAEQLLAAVPNPPPLVMQRRHQCIDALIKLYTEWNALDPGKGHDAQARQWQTKLPASQPATTHALP